jgi:hypothetical protein
MKQYNLASITSAAILATIVFAGVFAGPTAEAREQQTRGAYRQQLDVLLSENNSPCKTADDCEAVGVGTKPCGGPTEFILLSKSTRSKVSSDFDDLTKIITQMDVEANAADGTVGACTALKKPDLACNSGSCVKAPPPTPSPAAKK